jgi:hypothetical protein
MRRLCAKLGLKHPWMRESVKRPGDSELKPIAVELVSLLSLKPQSKKGAKRTPQALSRVFQAFCSGAVKEYSKHPQRNNSKRKRVCCATERRSAAKWLQSFTHVRGCAFRTWQAAAPRATTQTGIDHVVWGRAGVEVREPHLVQR